MKQRNYFPYLLLAPAIILILALYAYPVILTIIQSFHKVNLLGGSMEFVGLKNYTENIFNPKFLGTLKITFKYSIITVFLKIFFGFFVAYLLNSDIYFKKTFRFLALIPWAIPAVAVGTIAKWILNGDYGYLNYLLTKLHLIQEPINYLSSTKIAIYSLAIIDAWMGISMVSMMFLAGLEGIPKSLYEACEMDGGGAFEKFKDVTLPGIKQVFITTLILVSIWTFNSFTVIFVVTQGGPMRSTETLMVRIYQEAFSRFDLGVAAALSTVSCVILLIMTLFYTKRMITDEKK